MKPVTFSYGLFHYHYVMKILMVCLGNICRSPLAEALMHKHLEGKLTEYRVDSAGTGNWHQGEMPDKRSVAVAAKFGIDISMQRARQITRKDFESFDYIFTLDDTIHRDVRKLTSDPAHHAKIHLLRHFAGDNESLVPDPYYDGPDAFLNVYQLLDDACCRAAAKILSESK